MVGRNIDFQSFDQEFVDCENKLGKFTIQFNEKNWLNSRLLDMRLATARNLTCHIQRAFGVKKTREGGVEQENLVSSTELIG